MAGSPAVSVIIPAFRRPSMLREALESVIAQTLSDWEAIVVHETKGTTDPRPDIDSVIEETVQSLNDPRIQLIMGDMGGIIARSRNHAIAHAKGRYLAFLDDDDRWLPDKLARQMEVFEDPDVGLVYGTCATIDEEGGPLGGRVPSRWQTFDGNVLVPLLHWNFVPTSTVLVRKEAIGDGFSEDPELRAVEDWALWLEIAQDWRFAKVGEVTEYRVHNATASVGGGAKQAVAAAALMERWRSRLPRWADVPAAWRASRAAALDSGDPTPSELRMWLRWLRFRTMTH